MAAPTRETPAGATGGAAFDLGGLLAARGGERYALHRAHLNPQLPRMLQTIGFDRTYVRAQGSLLFDDTGADYLDMLAGFGVFALGRHHPEIRQAVHDVLDADLADLTQFDCAPLAGLLAEQVLARTPHLDRVYFGNSGTEAVEAAVKFARYATKRPRVLYLDHAFHGLTTGALSLNGAAEFRKGFGPLLPDTAVPLGDLDALGRELGKGDVAALVVEPVQGKGVAVPPPGYLAAAHRLLRGAGALLVADEVQSGVGRTGRFWAYEHDGVQPDIVAAAKALSGGYVPVGATIASQAVFDRVYSSIDRVLVHDSTFGSNAQAMAAGLATLHVLERDGVTAHAAAMGDLLLTRLRDLQGRFEMIGDVRGRGLMIGIEFTRPSGLRARAAWTALQTARVGLFAQTVVHALFHRHRILTQVSGDHLEVIKLIPPLVVTEDEVDRFVTAFEAVMVDAHAGAGLMWDFGKSLIAQARAR